VDDTVAVEATRRRGWRGLPLLLALLLALAALGWLEFIRLTPGPLAAGEGDSTRGSLRVEVGDRISVGVFSPTYRGDGTLVLDAVVPDQVPDGLVVLGYRRIPWGEGGVGSADRFPPGGHTLDPVPGATVTNGQAFAIVVGLQPVSEGNFVIPGFTVRYHAGFRNYAAHYQQAVVICASNAGTLGHC